MKPELEYNYFAATLFGWNGSNKREITKAEGCWDTEDDAQAALDAACEKKARSMVRQLWSDLR